MSNVKKEARRQFCRAFFFNRERGTDFEVIPGKINSPGEKKGKRGKSQKYNNITPQVGPFLKKSAIFSSE